MLVIVIVSSVVLAAHNMMWMSTEGMVDKLRYPATKTTTYGNLLKSNLDWMQNFCASCLLLVTGL